MDKYEDIKIGEKYLLPKGETIWLTALQETFITNKDMIIKITHTTFDKNSVFGIIQIVFHNYPLQFFMGDAAITYTDKTHGEVHLTFKQLQPLK